MANENPYAKYVNPYAQTVGVPDPSYPYEGPKAEADARRAQAEAVKAAAEAAAADERQRQEAITRQINIDNARQQAAINANNDRRAEQKLAADLAEANTKLAKAQKELGQEGDVSDKVLAAREVLRLLDGPGGLQEQYDQKFKGPNPLEWLPFRVDNAVFDSKSQALHPYIKKYMRTPGEGADNIKDDTRWDALRPGSGQFDAVNEQRLADLRSAAQALIQNAGLPLPTFNNTNLRQAAKVGEAARRRAAALDTMISQDGTGMTIAQKRGLKLINDAFQKGASLPELQKLTAQYGLMPAIDENGNQLWSLEDKIAQRDAGKEITFGYTPNPLKQRDLAQSAAGTFAASKIGSFLSNMDPTGWAPEIIGALGGDGEAAQGVIDATRQINPGSSLAGNVAGNIIGSVGAVGAAGKLAKGARYAPLAAETAYGALYGAGVDNESRLRGAAIGGASGAIGDLAGRYAVAPAARAVLDTRAGQKLLGPVNATRRKIGGMFGASPRNLEVAPKPAFEQRAITKPDNIDAIRGKLQDAQKLGVPYALADADPKLRALAGSASRKSENARALAENTFEPRSLGQADRLIEMIDQRLAPITNIEQRAKDFRTAAQSASAPYYEAAMARAGSVDPQVQEFLATPAGREALKNAYTIAGNEGIDPLKAGFDLNAQGEVVLKDAPSFQTLDLVKRGFDQRLSEYRNPITGKLDLQGNPQAQSIEGLRQRYVERLDMLNPAYKEARQAYADSIRPAEYLERGQSLWNQSVMPRQVQDAVAMTDPRYMGELQRGYATSLADKVNNMRDGSNPFKAVIGAPAQREKLAAIFPDAAATMDNIYGLESDMAKTMTETLGGSQTTARNAADAQFDGNAQMARNVADVGTGMAFGQTPFSAAMSVGARMVPDLINLGLRGSEKRADAIAPILFNTNPEQSLQFLDEAAAALRARKDYEGRMRRAAGMFGAPLGVTAYSAGQQY